MPDKNIDELLSKLSTDSKKETTNHSQLSDGDKITDLFFRYWKLLVGIVVVLAISLVVLVRYNANQRQEMINRDRLKQSQLSVDENKKKDEAEKKESDFLLTKAEYQANINYLVKADIGLERDSQKGLSGTLKVGEKIEQVLSYTRRDGVLHCLDDKEQPVSHSNKWVRAYIAKLQAQENIKKQKIRE